MFRLLENKKNDIIFYQIFTNYKKYDCSSICYDFNRSSNFNIDLSKYKNTPINCDIYLKGSIIQYINNIDNNIFTFVFQEEFIKETENTKLPMFLFKYKNTDNNKLPNLGKNNYDFYYDNVSLNIYNLSEKTLFIEQQFNNNYKNYFITKDISDIKKFLY